MSRPETCPERSPVCKACHCFVDDHVPLQSTLHKWWCHGCADHCDGFSHDAAPTPAPRETPTDGEWVHAAQRERERAVIENAEQLILDLEMTYPDLHVERVRNCRTFKNLKSRIAALRRGERKED